MTQPLSDLDLASLRARRDDVRARETAVSYRRRLLQAQLDIVAGIDEGDDEQLAARLASVLADEPSSVVGSPRAVGTTVEVAVDGPDALPDDLRSIGPEERAALVERLTAAEREASRERRVLLDELDVLQEELVRRYRRDGVDAAEIIGRDG